jgi:hypothetical protein
MHAALMHLTIDPALAPAAAAAFTHELLPRVRAAPGFVAGYWVDPVDRQASGLCSSRRRSKRSKQRHQPPVGQRPGWQSCGWMSDGSQLPYRNVSGARVEEGRLSPVACS